MVCAMEKSSSGEGETVLDLEIGNRTPIKVEHGTNFNSNIPGLYSNTPDLNSCSPNEENHPGCDLHTSEKKKKRLKKPPKPPRPPRPLSLDLSDQKLVNELTEIAMLKKARIERMKALKKMKNAKPASGTGSWCALVVTVIFCIVIFWHGLFSRGNGGIMGFHGSPESSFVSVQTYKNTPPTISPGGSTTSSSPKNVEPEMGLEMNGEKSGAVGYLV
ncbi:hypothetical protein LUZ62_014628 [Rhynchospora pubera]|uniref:Transmembrane protein n=1 Tax=Rhynchospora pubera TaxID=906938 RepID=A0AAV8GFH3_9POAL|nr:hypothetical protein LUZ62_014628 [Rhynchospora pubera]